MQFLNYVVLETELEREREREIERERERERELINNTCMIILNTCNNKHGLFDIRY